MWRRDEEEGETGCGTHRGHRPLLQYHSGLQCGMHTHICHSKQTRMVHIPRSPRRRARQTRKKPLRDISGAGFSEDRAVHGVLCLSSHFWQRFLCLNANVDDLCPNTRASKDSFNWKMADKMQVTVGNSNFVSSATGLDEGPVSRVHQIKTPKVSPTH